MKKKQNKKLAGGIVAFAVVMITIGILTYDDPAPNVKFIDENKVFLTAIPGETVKLKVNVENLEKRTVEGAKIITTLNDPEPDYIQIIDPVIELEDLIIEDRSGEQTIRIKVFQTLGTTLSFEGNAEVHAENYTTSTKSFKITLEEPDESG